MNSSVNQLSGPRKAILLAIKRDGAKAASELAAELEISTEAVRQHLMVLERDGWIERHSDRRGSHGGGRPTLRYRLTSDGEHLFPKHYDALAVELLDSVSNHLGSGALKQVLASMAEERVREWKPRLRGLTLEQRLEALKDFYVKGDGYMDIEYRAEGPALVERNCPVVNVVKQRPMLCAVTVTALTRLLGVRVAREKTFQNGDGCCVFQIYPNEPVDPDLVDLVVEGLGV